MNNRTDGRLAPFVNTMKVIRTLLTAGAAVLVSVAVADADDTDDQFLAGLGGINLPPAEAIDYGHQICDAVNNLPQSGRGTSPALNRTLRRIQDDLEGRGLSNDQATQLRLDAITTYCPDRNGSP